MTELKKHLFYKIIVILTKLFKTEASIPYTNNTRRILNSNSANNDVPDTRSNNAHSQRD